MELYVNIIKKLKGFTLNVEFTTGKDILGLLGESGSGKSMTLKCIAGLIKPDKGRIVLNDRVLFDSEEGIDVPIKDRRVGYLFQNYALFPHMTVEQNVGYALSSLPKAERKRIIAEKLEMMQIAELGKRYPHQLSGGQQQRTAIARALAVNPEALLLDEPFSALDNHLRNIMVKQMADTLSKFNGSTLFVTHNMEEAYSLCKDIIVLCNGAKEMMGNKRDVFAAPATVAAAKLTGCKNISSTKMISQNYVEALDWKCKLRLPEGINRQVTNVGIRAHYLELVENSSENTFNCWTAFTNETPFRRIIYLKLHNKPITSSDYELVWDISSEEWLQIKDKPQPWKIRLSPEKLIIIENRESSFNKK